MSALVTVNGFPMVAGDFVMPLTRIWHIDATIDCADPSKISGACTVDISDGALQFKGTAIADVYLNTVRARIVAGAGGMAKPSKPKAYQHATVGTVLGDLLTAAGESTAYGDQAIMTRVVDNWCVAAMPVADAVSLLMDHIGVVWRMLPDGSFWCGTDTWPDSELTFNVEQEDKAHQQLIVTLEAPLVLPGTTLAGRKASYVETHVEAGAVRTTVWVGDGDRLRDPVVAMTASALPGVVYQALYRCKVSSQSGQSFDLVPEDPRLPLQGFQAVPLRSGIPGLKVTVPPGSWLRLGWLGGDPSQPYCTLWEGGEAFTSMEIGSAADGVLTKADMTALLSAIASMASTGNTGGPLTFTAPTSFSSNSFKVQR